MRYQAIAGTPATQLADFGRELVAGSALILAGSALSVMSDLVEARAPLYGRAAGRGGPGAARRTGSRRAMGDE